MNKFKSIYKKTFMFCITKLIYGVIEILLATVLFLILFLIGNAIGNDILGFFLLIWLILVIAMLYFANHFFGYIVEAGHIASVADYVRTFMSPDSAYSYAVLRVRKRFTDSSKYRLTKKLIFQSLSEHAAYLERRGEFSKGTVSQMLSVLISIPLSYITNCIIGYIFYEDRHNTYKSASIGLAYYHLKWNKLLKNANFITVCVLVSVGFVAIVFFIIFMLMFNAIEATKGYAIIISGVFAYLFTATVKNAFIDSFFTVSEMTAYFVRINELHPDAEVVRWLSTVSKTFKRLYATGQRNQGATMQMSVMPEHLVSDEEINPTTYSPNYYSRR